tara:strand:- start:244734 stop:245258 length:525 start_codon:yes stop_codon:yes gene_type:complete
VFLSSVSCKNEKQPVSILAMTNQENNGIRCTDNGCSGSYTGAEFINGDDVAHQFSNTMSTAVGKKLKELYQGEKYRKVDFSSITMSTQGMGSGEVIYTLVIPFTTVNEPCDAYTSFDHVGGWNHTPALDRRKKELEEVTMTGHELEISKLKTTPEGLQEYWIQWKNKKTQVNCE